MSQSVDGMKNEKSSPLVPVKAIWEKDSISKYPETIRVPMDDGHVVNYRIDIEQPHPSFVKAIDMIKRGYPKKSRDL